MSTRTEKTDTFTQPGRRERKRVEQRTRIQRVAIDLFTRHGYDAVTVASITREADVAKGTFFNYFPTKADILISFWAELLDEVLAYGEALPAAEARTCFRRFFNNFSRRVESNAEMFDLLVCQVAYQPGLRKVEGDSLARTRSLYAGFLARGRPGRVRDLDLLTEMIRDLWVGTLRSWVFSGHAFALGKRMDRKLGRLLGVDAK